MQQPQKPHLNSQIIKVNGIVYKITFNNQNNSYSITNQFQNVYPIAQETIEKVIDPQKERRKQIISPNFPYTSIGILECTFTQKGIKRGYGTAFFIENGNILTCAHVVYDSLLKSFPTFIRFTPASCNPYLSSQNQGNFFYNIKTIFIPKQYIDSKNGKYLPYKYDYALLIVNTIDFLPQKYGKFQIQVNQLKVGDTVAVCGFPFDLNKKKNNDQEIIDTLFGCVGEIKQQFQNQIVYDLDTNRGQSGSPVYRTTYKEQQIIPSLSGYPQKSSNENYELVGIHIRTDFKYNIGIRLDNQMYQKINFWLDNINKNIQQKKTLCLPNSYTDEQLHYRNVLSFWMTQNMISKKTKFQCLKYSYFYIQDTKRLGQISQSLLLLKDFSAAISTLEKIIDIYLRSFRKNDYKIARIKNFIGKILFYTQRYFQAQQIFLQSKSIFEAAENFKTVDALQLLILLDLIKRTKKQRQLTIFKNTQILQAFTLKLSSVQINQQQMDILFIAGSIACEKKNIQKAFIYLSQSLMMKQILYGQTDIQYYNLSQGMTKIFFYQKDYINCIFYYYKAPTIQQLKLKPQINIELVDKNLNTLWYNQKVQILYKFEKHKSYIRVQLIAIKIDLNIFDSKLQTSDSTQNLMFKVAKKTMKKFESINLFYLKQ